MGVITKQVENERLSNYDDSKRYKYQDHVNDLPTPQVTGEWSVVQKGFYYVSPKHYRSCY